MNQAPVTRHRFVVPILVILLGIAWLLNVMDVIPQVDWIWTVGLAAAGLLPLAFSKVNKLTVVIGPFFLVAAISSVFRQTGVLSLDREIPILTIVFGCLLLIAQLTRLSLPKALVENYLDAGKRSDSEAHGN